ncbi:hypothetical protein L208DRAFT_1535147 [Tricholoma matsutake]|nr:hypothetical protein L208DRAFT_1535147 [Tricholoma matsutake 945]
MPGHPQLLTVTTAPMYWQILLNKVYNLTNVIWSLEPATLKLTKWHWPIHARKHVAPGTLHEHCKHYQFLGPSCLCPLLQQVSEDLVFTEVAIYMPVFGRYAREYIAECANGRCGYIGQSPSVLKNAVSVYSGPVPLQRLYQVVGIPVRMFPPRGKLGGFSRAQSTYHIL